MSGCEGRCGLIVEAGGFEVHPRTQGPSQRHTVARCVATRTYKDTLVRGLKRWAVEVWPVHGDILATHAERVIDGRVWSLTQHVPLTPPWVLQRAANMNLGAFRVDLGAEGVNCWPGAERD